MNLTQILILESGGFAASLNCRLLQTGESGTRRNRTMCGAAALAGQTAKCELQRGLAYALELVKWDEEHV